MNLYQKKEELKERIDGREKELARLMVGAHNLIKFAGDHPSINTKVAAEAYINALCELGESLEEACSDYMEVYFEYYSAHKDVSPKEVANTRQQFDDKVKKMKDNINGLLVELQETFASKL